MTSAQLWLRLLPVIGLIQHSASLRLHSRDYIKGEKNVAGKNCGLIVVDVTRLCWYLAQWFLS